MSSKKKSKRNIWNDIPYDCWCEVISFIGNSKDFLSLLRSIKGLYAYLKQFNPRSANNCVFKLVEMPQVPSQYQYVRKLVAWTSRITVSKHVDEKKLWERQFNNDYIERIFQNFKNLESLKIRRENHREVKKYRYNFPQFGMGNQQRTCRTYHPPKEITFGENIRCEKLQILHIDFYDGDYCGTITIVGDSFPVLKSLIFERTFHRKTWLTISLGGSSFPKLEHFQVDGDSEYMMQLNIEVSKDRNSRVYPKDLSKNLKTIKLRSTSIPFKEFITSKTLETLVLWNIRFWGKELSVYIDRFPNLRTLKCCSLGEKKEEKQIKLVYPTYIHTKLKRLKIRGTTSSMREFSKFPNLVYLNFDIKVEDLAAVKTQSLPLQGETGETYLPQKLEQLKISTSYNFCVKIYSMTLPPNLKCLKLRVTRNDIIVDPQSLRNITSLTISDSFLGAAVLKRRRILINNNNKKKKKKTHRSKKRVPKLLKKESGKKFSTYRIFKDLVCLKTLILENCRSFQNVVIEKCSSLESLHLVYNSFKGIRLSSLNALKTLKIRGDDIRKFFIEESSCMNISSLTLHNCKRFHIPENYKKNLRHLRIWDCWRRILNKTDTIDGMVFRQLEHLEVFQDFCGRVTTVKHLKNLPKLRRIDTDRRPEYVFTSVRGEFSENNIIVVKMKSTSRFRGENEEPRLSYEETISGKDFVKIIKKRMKEAEIRKQKK